jgi:hypothetical protein
MRVLPNWRENANELAMIENAAHDVDETDDPDQRREGVLACWDHVKEGKD